MRVFPVPSESPYYKGCGDAVGAISPDGQLVDWLYVGEPLDRGDDADVLKSWYPDHQILHGVMSCWQFVVKP